jgi:hypothetical protein
VTTLAEAARFINAAGYCALFPLKNVPLPSLYYAVARRMPITWDKYSMKVWTWKDELGARRLAFYGKYFKGRGSFISLEFLPPFLAVEGTPAAPEDHERFYAAGRISHEACAIWEALERDGPLATLELRHACKMDSKAGNARFKRAMLELQRKLLVVHFGTEQETEAWASGRFELVSRAFPKQVEAARQVTRAEAQAAITKRYLRWHPDANASTQRKLFDWTPARESK